VKVNYWRVLLLLSCLLNPSTEIVNAALQSAQSGSPDLLGEPLAPTPAQAAQGFGLLQQSLTAQIALALPVDVQLSGSIVMTDQNGSQTGTILMKAIGDQQSEITLNLPSGAPREVRIIPISRPDPRRSRLPLVLAPHPAWFFPPFLFFGMSSLSNYLASYQGLETRNGQPVHHVSIWQRAEGLDGRD